ncbi:hypothetical protein JMUB6875_25070 [Nocardia sp. JMUB6875]
MAEYFPPVFIFIIRGGWPGMVPGAICGAACRGPSGATGCEGYICVELLSKRGIPRATAASVVMTASGIRRRCRLGWAAECDF